MDKFNLIQEFNNGDKLYLSSNTIFIKFSNKRNGIVTSQLNGGFKKDFTGVFNHQLSQEAIDENSIELYLEGLSKGLAKKFNVKANEISGLITSAKMGNAGMAIEKFRKLEVAAISTAGTNVNAASAGDPAGYYEENGEFDLKIGTINTIVLINSKLDESVLLQALMTATEAKTVALRELMVSSRYSSEIATGTGTDGIAIFSNMESDNQLSNAGKHSKLGELIAKTVISSIKKSLAKQIWLTPTYQSNALLRLSRFDVDLDKFYDKIDDKEEFISSLAAVNRDTELVGYISLILYILDQYRYGLIIKTTACKIINSIFDNQMSRKNWKNMKILVKFIVKSYLK